MSNLQYSNLEDSLQRTATKRQLTYTWNPGGCIINSFRTATGKALIIKESKLKMPDYWGVTGIRQWGCWEQAHCFCCFFLSNYCKERPGEPKPHCSLPLLIPRARVCASSTSHTPLLSQRSDSSNTDYKQVAEPL